MRAQRQRRGTLCRSTTEVLPSHTRADAMSAHSEQRVGVAGWPPGVARVGASVD